MPILDEKTLEEAKLKGKKKIEAGVQERMYGDTKVWIGAGGIVYSSFSEAHDSIQSANEQGEFKKRGLNEQGQTPEQVAKAKKRAELFKKREAILKEVSKIDQQISEASLDEKIEDIKQSKHKK